MTSEGQARSRSGIIAMIVIVLLALGAGMLTASLLFKSKTDFSALSATVFQQPRAVQPFELLDHHGESFTPESLRGQWSFVFFGYTHCPDVCPTTLATLADAADRVDDDRMHVLFVSLDPERDDLGRLGDYVTTFDPAFLAAMVLNAGVFFVVAQRVRDIGWNVWVYLGALLVTSALSTYVGASETAAVVATGALMTHGLSEGAGLLHFAHDPRMRDEELYRKGYNRPSFSDVVEAADVPRVPRPPPRCEDIRDEHTAQDARHAGLFCYKTPLL